VSVLVSVHTEFGDQVWGGASQKRTQPKLADGTLLRDGLLDDGFGLSTLGFLFLCKGLVGTALLGCLDLLCLC